MKRNLSLILSSLLLLLGIGLFAIPNPELKSYLAKLKAKAKTEDSSFRNFSAKNGEKIFRATQTGKNGQPISCMTCHTQDLTKFGENNRTGKIIKPLAPSANPKSLTKVRKIKKWLRRNFKDVYGREGSAKEKGDVLYFLIDQ